MKKLSLLLFLLFHSFLANAQNIGGVEERLQKSYYQGHSKILYFTKATLAHMDVNSPVWTSDEIQKLLKKTMMIRIRPEQGDTTKKLREKYKITSWPVLVFADWQDKEKKRFKGRLERRSLTYELKKFIRSSPRPISARKSRSWKSYLAKAQKYVLRKDFNKALSLLKQVSRKKSAFGYSLDAKKMIEKIKEKADKDIDKTITISKEEWDKKIKKIRRQYKGISLDKKIKEIAKKRFGNGESESKQTTDKTKTLIKKSPFYSLWKKALLLDSKKQYWKASKIFSRLQYKKEFAKKAKAKLKKYKGAKIRKLIAKQKKDSKCKKLKKYVENCLMNKNKRQAVRYLEKLKREKPHPLAKWAEKKLTELGPVDY